MDDPLERFAGVYDQYYRNVLRYLLQHAEQGTAEDVASETFLIAWRRFPAIPDPPLPWLLGVARNLLRKQASSRTAAPGAGCPVGPAVLGGRRVGARRRRFRRRARGRP